MQCQLLVSKIPRLQRVATALLPDREGMRMPWFDGALVEQSNQPESREKCENPPGAVPRTRAAGHAALLCEAKYAFIYAPKFRSVQMACRYMYMVRPPLHAPISDSRASDARM